MVDAAAEPGGPRRADGARRRGDGRHTGRPGPGPVRTHLARRTGDRGNPGEPLPVPVLPRRHRSCTVGNKNARIILHAALNFNILDIWCNQ
jgi:hypothetical protein